MTPKLGAKWTPVREFALRGTYSEGFRAPSPAENGKGGLAAFSTAIDPLRCKLGVAAACNPATVALITSPNPALEPEKSKSYTLGFVWDPTPKTSIALDFFQIVRKNEINQEQTDAAIAKGQVSRDPSTATAIPGDPGAIIAVLTNYVNSSSSTVRGVDLDAKQGFDLELLRAVRAVVDVPLVASGDAGKVEHFPPAVEAGADAVLAASVFHFGDLTVGQVKAALTAAGHLVR